MRETVDSDRENLPAYFETLSYKARIAVEVECPHCKKVFNIPGGGDKECAMYLVNRHLGTAKQTVDSNIKATRVYSAEELHLMGNPMLDEKKLLTEWGEEGTDIDS